jgi:hypothetical protein
MDCRRRLTRSGARRSARGQASTTFPAVRGRPGRRFARPAALRTTPHQALTPASRHRSALRKHLAQTFRRFLPDSTPLTQPFARFGCEPTPLTRPFARSGSEPGVIHLPGWLAPNPAHPEEPCEARRLEGPLLARMGVLRDAPLRVAPQDERDWAPGGGSHPSEPTPLTRPFARVGPPRSAVAPPFVGLAVRQGCAERPLGERRTLAALSFLLLRLE